MSDTNLSDLPEFTLNGPVDFEPTYYPERVKPGKERNLTREDGLCDGEDITDTGSKNKDIHIRGYLLESEKETFWNLLDTGGEHTMVAMPWSGMVYIENGDLNGPLGIDNQQDEWVYEYTLDVVEAAGQEHSDNGIVSSGN